MGACTPLSLGKGAISTMTGDDLRALRMRAGWKQTQLATALRVSPQYIGMLERGVKEILPHMAEATQKTLADALSSNHHMPNSKLYCEAKAAVVIALKKSPDLSLNGYPCYNHFQDEFNTSRSIHESRAALFTDDSVAQIATALAWIDAVKVLKTPKVSSYGAKHHAEVWGRENSLRCLDRCSYLSSSAVAAHREHAKCNVRTRP